MTRLQPPPITLLDKYYGDDFQVQYSSLSYERGV